MNSINSLYFSTIYPEVFPSFTTLQKLVRSKAVIVADNLLFNKRDKVNLIPFNNRINFSVPIKHNQQVYSHLQIDNRTNWQRKLIRIFDDVFKQSTIYYFHQHELHQLIKSFDNYIDLSIAMLHFSCHLMKLNCEIKMASSLSDKFDLNLILDKSEGIYLVESKYTDFLRISGFKNFDVIKNPEKNSDLIRKSPIALTMEFGHYLPHLILGF